METATNLLLYGNHELKFDESSRISIPGSIRNALDPERDGNGFFAVDGVNRKLWLYPDKLYRAMVSHLSSEMTPGPDQLAFDHLNVGSAELVEWDKQGRLRIPEKTLKEVGLEKEVTLVGARNHLELWDRQEWHFHLKDLRARAAEVAMRARQADKNAQI